jgi:hypothetical protein
VRVGLDLQLLTGHRISRLPAIRDRGTVLERQQTASQLVKDLVDEPYHTSDASNCGFPRRTDINPDVLLGWSEVLHCTMYIQCCPGRYNTAFFIFLPLSTVLHTVQYLYAGTLLPSSLLARSNSLLRGFCLPQTYASRELNTFFGCDGIVSLAS